MTGVPGGDDAVLYFMVLSLIASPLRGSLPSAVPYSPGSPLRGYTRSCNSIAPPALPRLRVSKVVKVFPRLQGGNQEATLGGVVSDRPKATRDKDAAGRLPHPGL